MLVEVFVLILLTVAIALLVYITWARSYWKRRGMYTLPQKTLTHTLIGYNILREKGLKYGGFYNFFRPYLLTTDLNLIKSMVIRDFDHFVNHSAYFNEEDDPLSATLENLENEHWKQVRSMVTPAFSTGKMKQMFPTIVDHTSALVEVMNDYAESNKPLHVKNLIERFAMDALGSSAFGIELNTLHNKNKDFQEAIKKTGKVDWRKLTAYLVNWRLLRFVGFRTCRYKVMDYFRDLVRDVKEYRQKNNVFRKDLFQYLSQLERDQEVVGRDMRLMKHHSLTLDQITTQCFSLLGGGFDTSSALVSFALLELALNTDIQHRLHENIDECLKKHGTFSYEAVRDMYYLEWVINETLRRHPPAPGTNRCCNKAYQIPGTDVIIEPWVKVVIPIVAIHNDPEYYPEPEKFDPERFSPENTAKRDPITFIPFGEGPRKCVGSRLAMMQAKIGVATVIKNFEITLNEKTKQPLTYSSETLLLSIEGGVWINLRKIT